MMKGGGGASSTRDDGSSSPSPPGRRWKRNKQLTSIAVALTIGSFSILELLEGLREEADRFFFSNIGHAHGMLILSLIRLSRSIAIFQTQADELAEATEEIRMSSSNKNNNKDGKSKMNKKNKFLTMIGRFVISRNVSIVACLVASLAAFLEIYDDLKPGGHHGAGFLALSELNYQINRGYSMTHEKGKEKKEKATSNNTSLLSSIMKQKRKYAGPLIFLSAALFAATEIYDDLKPGAHHAVALLAVAELVENMSLFEKIEKKNKEQ